MPDSGQRQLVLVTQLELKGIVFLKMETHCTLFSDIGKLHSGNPSGGTTGHSNFHISKCDFVWLQGMHTKGYLFISIHIHLNGRCSAGTGPPKVCSIFAKKNKNR